MSWNGGLNIGASFAEITAQRGQDSFQKCWFLPKQSLQDGIRSFFTENPQIDKIHLRVSTQLADWVIEKQMGGQFAWLCSSGFENWSRLNLPVKEANLTLLPSRPNTLLNKDFIFGIDERMSPSGESIRSPQTEDLEFLASKLQLADLHTVAIGFLHSDRNPEHELAVTGFLRDKGFKVRHSSNYPVSSEGELDRWRLCILDSYVSRDLEEQRERLSKIQAETPQIERLDFVEMHNSPFLSQYAWDSSRESGSGILFYCGYERFFLIKPGHKDQRVQTHYGALAVQTPAPRMAPIQPTQIVAKGLWHVPAFSERQLGFEPGPMLLGKSLVPTFLDLLFLLFGTEGLGQLAGMCQEKSEKRILETLFTLAKDQIKHNDLDSRTLAKSLVELATNLFVQELCATPDETKSVTFVGPLASLIAAQVKDRLPANWKTAVQNDDFALSRRLSTMENA